jgi:hypothetical protein
MESEKGLREETDPIQKLQLWAQAHKGLAPAEQIRRFLAWLPAANSDEWHGVAASWNWGFGIQPLRWIISQPECGAATAALIFFDGEPLDTDDDSDVGKLLGEIRARWPHFPDHNVAYAPPRYVARIGELHMDRIPLDIRQPRSGREISSEAYQEGIPISLFEGG